MKALSKPISSPSRAESFPPPLMRFMSRKAGGRSRARSRSSPMFYMHSKRNIETNSQEPSSPKVTCIGQVRATKSKAKKAGAAAVNRRSYWWLLKKPLFCVKVSTKLFKSQKRVFRRFFCKWGSFFKAGYCKRIDAREDSFRVDWNKKIEENTENIAEFHRSKCEINEESERDIRDGSSCSYSQPKNALLLTRCRSAPYRSSSLGGRFWSENEEDSKELMKKLDSQRSGENCEEIVEDLKGTSGGAMQGLVLTRCKSEPARTGEKLNPEANFLETKRRLGAIEFQS